MTKRRCTTELQIWTPEKKREASSSRRITVASSRDSTSFTLPTDWCVDEKKRSSRAYRAITDKYYHEPGTGRKFRSLASVKRHLTETDCHEISTQFDYGCKSDSKPGSFMKKFQCKTNHQIVVYRKPYTHKHQVSMDQSKPFKLPDGWFIKRCIRRSGHSMGKVDKYYCERTTGRVFRSLIDVQRYLSDTCTEENTTLSKLFKPDGFIQMSESEEKDSDGTTNSDMAIVPYSCHHESYSDHSDDMLLKDLVRKNGDLPLKDVVRDDEDIPLKNLVAKSADVPLRNFVRKSKVALLKDLVQKADDVLPRDLEWKSDNVPVNDLVRKSDDVPLTGIKTKKHIDKQTSPAAHVFNSTSKILPVIASNHPIKIKWVLNGPGGDDWCPFTGDAMVPESLKQEWAKMFVYIVSQNFEDGKSYDALV